MTQPFTYSITHIPSGVHYYGVRYGKNCSPADLGTTYFSSSILVKKLIFEESTLNFKFRVRKIFQTKQKAVAWERKFLTRVNASASSKWFNKHNGNRHASKGGYKLDEVTKQKMRKPKSPEHRAKLASNLDLVRTIPVWTEERLKSHAENMKGNSFGSIPRKTSGWSEERLAKHREKMKGNTLGSNKTKQSLICPHCGKEGKQPNMTRYHFLNCSKSFIVHNNLLYTKCA